MDRLKEMLKNLKEPELKERKSLNSSKFILENILPMLLTKMRDRYEKEIEHLFQNSELTIYIDGHGFPNLVSAYQYITDNVKFTTKDLKIEYRSSGFKSAGRKAFDCWTGLHIILHDYKVSFGLFKHPPIILLEKLYHETIIVSEEDMLIEKWMEGLLDDITLQVERIQARG